MGSRDQISGREEGVGGPYFTLKFFMPLSSIYSFQKSAGVTARMFRAVAMVTSLAAHTVLLGGWEAV